MTIREAQQKLLFQLYHIYDNHEALAITNLVLENLVGWKRIDRIINKNVLLSKPQLDLFSRYANELSTHKPVQYVLHEAWFRNLKFYVDESVLIPRPETEELVDWIVTENKRESSSPRNQKPFSLEKPQNSPLTLLDIGSGSGCIPIALKKELENATVFSCDISEKALAIAKRNALSNNTEVDFLQLDFLNKTQRDNLSPCQIIVSNPPYIPANERSSMAVHVVNFEPDAALFVNDDNPLIFYEAIADFALDKLLTGGMVYTEIHEDFSSNVKELFLRKGFSSITVKKDIHGKNRMLKATMLP